jgi:hypothetical protein
LQDKRRPAATIASEIVVSMTKKEGTRYKLLASEKQPRNWDYPQEERSKYLELLFFFYYKREG